MVYDFSEVRPVEGVVEQNINPQESIEGSPNLHRWFVLELLAFEKSVPSAAESHASKHSIKQAYSKEDHTED